MKFKTFISLCSCLSLSAFAQADYVAYLELPGEEIFRLSSYSWDHGLGSTGPRSWREGLVAPESGEARVIISKAVTLSIPTLTNNCEEGTVLNNVAIEIPLREQFFSEPDEYYQRYQLEDVTVNGCLHAEGAKAEVFYLDFTNIQKIGEAHLLSR